MNSMTFHTLQENLQISRFIVKEYIINLKKNMLISVRVKLKKSSLST